MDTGSPKLTSFLGSNNVQFVIPVYQRNYDWKEDNCRQLLDDIIEVGKAPKEANKVHFIGSIVYVCNSVCTTEDIKKFVIIDGQHFAEILRLRETPESFHRCAQLNSTYYFDVNLSASDMFSNLKKILSKLDLTDELYIKFRGATIR